MIRPTYKIERGLLRQGIQMIAGCDEVGRGCLAGPVVAAMVVLPAKLHKDWRKLVRDSKTLSRPQRVAADAFIRAHAVAFGVGVVDVATIDRINILQASFEAMRRAFEHPVTPSISPLTGGGSRVLGQSSPRPLGRGWGRSGGAITHILVDGKFIIPGIENPQTAIIHGDAVCLSIAAASVIAKEFRDKLMEKLHDEHPEYGFNENKGYGTPRHLAEIRKLGLTEHHRMTFCKAFETGAQTGTNPRSQV